MALFSTNAKTNATDTNSKNFDICQAVQPDTIVVIELNNLFYREFIYYVHFLDRCLIHSFLGSLQWF